MPGLLSCGMPHKSNTKFLFQTVYFWGGFRVFTTSPYVVYDYTSSGNMELWIVLYVEYTNTFLYSAHTFLYNIFTSNAIKM